MARFSDNTETPSKSFRRQLKALRGRLPIILLCTALCDAAALAYSLNQPKEYTAKAVLLFRDPGYGQSIIGLPSSPQTDPQRLAATNTKLVALTVVSDRAARSLGPGFTGARVARESSISSEGQADLVGISTADKSPATSARIANAIAQQYILFRRSADFSKVNSATDLARRELATMAPDTRRGARGRLLQDRIDQLETLASLQTGNAELVQRATAPTHPSSPRPTRDAALAGVLGFLVGLACALLLDRLDTRVRDPQEIEDLIRRPVLGAIPRSRAFSRANRSLTALPPAEAEAFRLLRASLRYLNVDSDIRSVLVTSADPSEGKSTVALNLALAAAETGTRTLLLDADLRRPILAKALGLPPARGLTSVLTSDATLASVTRQIPVPRQGGAALPDRQLDIVVAGAVPPHPSALMESEKLQRVLHEAESQYDLVVIDTPPISVVSDAIPLVDQASGVLVVTRLGKTRRGELTHLRKQLSNLGGPLLGIVVNFLGRDVEGYGYAHAYGYKSSGTDDVPAFEDEDYLEPGSTVDNGSNGPNRPRHPDGGEVRRTR